MDPNWLKDAGRLIFAGQLYPGWLVRKNLLIVMERDEAGHHFLSNETLGLYVVGLTHEEAVEDLKATLIDNYRRLEARMEEEPDLKPLFQEYQVHLRRTK